MLNLNNFQDYKKYDSKGMVEAIAGMPSDIIKGIEKAKAFDIPEDCRNVKKIVFTGMGGSAMSGELVRILMASESSVPAVVVRDYYLPDFVNEDTLVIASSFSGGTAETISAMVDAFEKRAKVIAFSRGGELAKEAESKGIPAFNISYDGLPRASLGFTLSALLCFIEKLGFVKDKSADFKETVRVMKEWQEEIKETVPIERNAAKQLALKMNDKAVVVYGADTLYGVARRWKQQINENAKHLTLCGEIPEMNHNMLLGLEFPQTSVKNLMWIFLTSDFDFSNNKRRTDATREAGENAGVKGEVISGRGNCILSHIFSTIHFGDFVSFYLGMIHETDPSDLSAVSVFKERMQS